MESSCPHATSSKTLDVSNGEKENFTMPYAELLHVETLDCFSIVKQVEIIGRVYSALIALKDIEVSRNHCSFLKKPNGLCELTSQGKTGTKVNNIPCPDSGVVLKTGDIIQISKHTFIFMYLDNPVAQAMEVNIPLNAHKSLIEQRRSLLEFSQNEEKAKLNKVLTDLMKEKEDAIIKYKKTISRYSKGNDTASKDLDLKKDALMKEMDEKLEAFKKKEEMWTKERENLEKRLVDQKEEFETKLREELLTTVNLTVKMSKLKRKAEEQMKEFEIEAKIKKETHEELQMLREQLELKENEVKSMRESFGRDLECGICSELCIEAVQINCGHIFCKFCIDTWKKKKKECPMCRTKIKNEMRSWHYEGIIEKIIKFIPEDERKQREELIKKRSHGNCHEKCSTSVIRRGQQSASNRNATPPVVTRVQNRRSTRQPRVVIRGEDLFAWDVPPRINVTVESTVTSTRGNEDILIVDDDLTTIDLTNGFPVVPLDLTDHTRVHHLEIDLTSPTPSGSSTRR